MKYKQCLMKMLLEILGVFSWISPRHLIKFGMTCLIFKLKAYGIEGELLSLLENYLQNREQRVVLNGQTFEWRKINSGVP